MVVNIAVFCGFLLIVVVMGFFLWQTLFASKDHHAKPHAQATYSDQQSGNKNSTGASVTSSLTNPAEEAIAEYTRWLAFFTAALVLATVALFISGERNVEVASRSADAANTSANAAMETANAARQTLIATQRAWVKVKLSVSGPLVFDQNGASTSIGFKISNIGNVPATGITPNAWLMALTSGGPYPFQELQRRCNAIRDGGFGVGFTLFPNEEFPEEKGFSRWSLGVSMTTDDIKKALPASKDGKYVALYVVGCIDYTFPTDPKAHHQTGFVYELLRNGPYLLSPEDGTIPIEGLMLRNSDEMGAGRHID